MVFSQWSFSIWSCTAKTAVWRKSWCKGYADSKTAAGEGRAGTVWETALPTKEMWV